MGASHSGEEESRKKLRAFRKETKAYKESLGKFRQSQILKGNPLPISKWKDYLIDLLTEEPQSLQLWGETSRALIKSVVNDTKDNSIWWIANFQRLPFSFSTYNSQFSITDDTSVLDCDKIEEEKVQHDLSPRYYSANSSLFGSIRSASPTRAMMGSAILSNCESQRPATHELKLNLRNQINNPKHIAHELVQEFRMHFDKLFGGYVPQLQKGDIMKQQADKIYLTAKSLIKHFVKVIKEFVIWVYGSLMEHFISGLNQEDFNLYAVVEDLIYEMLFNDPNSSIYQLVFIILKKKCASDIQKFQQSIEGMSELSLEDYDKNMTNSPLLLKGTKPMYGRVIRRLRKMRKVTSPYQKYEEIILLDQAIISCINDYYKEDNEQIKKAEESLGRDAKANIFPYCMVQSKNKNLVIDRAFIEEFVEPNCLGATPHFPAFCSSVGYILANCENTRRDSKSNQEYNC